MNNELIRLLTIAESPDDVKGLGEDEVVKETEIFAHVKSVGRTEYYEALRNGINLSVIFVINPDDFKLADIVVGKRKRSASKVVYDGGHFQIKRTYVRDVNVMEIMCERVE